MKLIVEEFNYKSEEAKKILAGFNHRVLEDGVSTDCVGYCYSKSLDDCVFFLPKVVCDSSGKLLGKDSPELFIDVEHSDLSSADKEFIQGLSVWIYRSLKVYSENKKLKEESSKILLSKSFSVVNSVGDTKSGTLLDKILALIRFYNENKDFFIFTMRSIHSQQHKINWSRTISRSQVFFQDNVPVYINPVSKKKSIDWDEELMVIFFSILEDIKKYGFDIRTDNNYALIKGDAFKEYRNGLGIRKLRQIKHRYFSDKTRKLWSLCYAYFDTTDIINSSKEDSDYLMATDYHVAFESMVNELIGDPELDSMRKLDDGKVIDHIYRDTSLLSNDLIYYIGDSKYYQTSRSVGEKSTSTYKQYTYARNIVHNSITHAVGETWPFRDKLTEGYVITPNFFIRAEIAANRQYDSDGFDRDSYLGHDPYSSRQFNGRLFDRDTLWVNQYNLNFLYLLSAYAAGNSEQKRLFRDKAHRFFRNGTIDLLNSRYVFWVLSPKAGKTLKETLQSTVKWDLRGLVYRLGNENENLLLALEKPREPEKDENRSYTIYERNAEFNRIKPIVQNLFEHKRCLLSKERDQHIQYVDLADTPKEDLVFLFDDEMET